MFFSFNNIEELLVGEGDPNSATIQVDFVDENAPEKGSLKGENDIDATNCRYSVDKDSNNITLSGGDFNKCAYEYSVS